MLLIHVDCLLTGLLHACYLRLCVRVTFVSFVQQVLLRIASASVVWIVTSETGLCRHLSSSGVQIIATVALGRVAMSAWLNWTEALPKPTFSAVLHAKVVKILTL
jgi:hypothetical protein